MKKKLSIVLLIIWMIVIFAFSSAEADKSTNSSDQVINTFIEIKDKITDNKTSDYDKEIITNNLTYIVRKTAHVTEYLILAILMYNALYNFNINNIKLAFLLSVIYSCTDEFHQLFVPGRTGRLVDVLIDSIGIIIGLYLYKIKINKKEKISTL